MSRALRLTDPWLTADQFLDWPGDGTGRAYQLIDGEPVAMSPAMESHGRLQARLARWLGNHLAAHRPGCEVVVAAGVQPRADAAHNVRVPDLLVTCSPDTRRYTEEPVLIVEILSPSNARETREAVRACLSIPSLREALVLGSEAMVAEVLTRDADGAWPAQPVPFGPGDTLVLETLGFEIAIDALYADLGMRR